MARRLGSNAASADLIPFGSRGVRVESIAVAVATKAPRLARINSTTTLGRAKIDVFVT
jgi:hypothetical protein